MGAKQSKRSVDITTTPKKGEGVTVEGEGKLEKIADIDGKITTNGIAHEVIEATSEKELAAKVENEAKESESKEEIKENGVSEGEEPREVAEPKTPEAPVALAEEDTAGGDQAAADSSVEKTPESGDAKIEETPDSKKKDKSKKKKWSFRSISFSKKDKSKPSKDAEKNGEVKEVAEENVEETVASPVVESPPPKGEEVKTPEPVKEAALLANGDASVEELAKPEEPGTAEQPAAAAAGEAAKTAEEPAKTAPEEPKAPEPAVEEEIAPAAEESKEVRSEEIPPPLPSSNPPSPVTAFAESTKDEVLEKDLQSVTLALSPPTIIPEPVLESSVPENFPEPPSSPAKESQPEPLPPPPAAPQQQEPSSTEVVVVEAKEEEVKQEEVKREGAVIVEEPKPAEVEVEVEAAEPVAQNAAEERKVEEQKEPERAESPLPEPVSEQPVSGNSTESLPSLPEPVSESMPEPVSLPPADSAPEPIAAPAPGERAATPLTNGTAANGIESPTAEEAPAPPPPGPVKQVPVDIEEVRQEAAEKTTEVVVAESTPATVEE